LWWDRAGKTGWNGRKFRLFIDLKRRAGVLLRSMPLTLQRFSCPFAAILQPGLKPHSDEQ
jgi:hypothetical protein